MLRIFSVILGLALLALLGLRVSEGVHTFWNWFTLYWDVLFGGYALFRGGAR